MGSCVSVRGEEPGSARFRLALGAQVGEALAPPPSRALFQSGDGLPVAGFEPKNTPEEAGLGFRSPRFGTKDETFFDSQQWLESDCEDDFFSVNGDMTPSRGSTPNHPMATPIKVQQHEAALILDGFSERAKSEPSPRKTLAELLQETMPAEPEGNEHNTAGVKARENERSELDKTITDQPPSPLEGTPYLSTTNSITGERTPDGNFRDGKEKRGKAKLCCLPSLVRSLSSFNEKKRMPSPWRHSGG